MNFDTYWREFGKVEDEVTKNCKPFSKLEEDFKKFAKKVWDSAPTRKAYTISAQEKSKPLF